MKRLQSGNHPPWGCAISSSMGTACPLSGRNSTYRPVQILQASSAHIEEPGGLRNRSVIGAKSFSGSYGTLFELSVSPDSTHTVSVWSGLRAGPAGNGLVTAWARLQHEGLAEALGQLFADGARYDVAGAAGTDTDDYADRPRRIDLRVNLRHQHEQTSCNQ